MTQDNLLYSVTELWSLLPSTQRWLRHPEECLGKRQQESPAPLHQTGRTTNVPFGPLSLLEPHLPELTQAGTDRWSQAGRVFGLPAPGPAARRVQGLRGAAVLKANVVWNSRDWESNPGRSSGVWPGQLTPVRPSASVSLQGGEEGGHPKGQDSNRLLHFGPQEEGKHREAHVREPVSQENTDRLHPSPRLRQAPAPKDTEGPRRRVPPRREPVGKGRTVYDQGRDLL